MATNPPQTIMLNEIGPTAADEAQHEQHTSESSLTDSQSNKRDSSPMKHSRSIGGAYGDITLALVGVTVPMILLSATFIGLVFNYRLSDKFTAPERMTVAGDSYDNSAYYVNFSATRLITVASWTSTATSFTATFVMGLLSYTLAASYLRDSKMERSASLLTPYQLALVVNLLGGGLGSLWTWFKYCLWKKTTKQVRILITAAICLTSTISLGFAILGVDTWLHVTTSTVRYDALTAVSQPQHSYGRGLNFSCFDVPQLGSDPDECAGYQQGPGKLLFQSSEVMKTLTNLSSLNTVLPCTLDGKDFAYIGAAQPDPFLDYEAETIAISSTCNAVSKACSLTYGAYCAMEACPGMDALTPTMQYNCSSTLYGDMENNTGTPFNSDARNVASYNKFFMQIFQDPDFANPYNDYLLPNPFYFAVGAEVFPSDALSSEETDNNAMVTSGASYRSGFILSCQTTVYNLRYRLVNGSVVDNSHTYTLSNSTIVNNIGWVLQRGRDYIQTVFESALISGAQQTNTTKQFADVWALRFSQAAAGSIAGVIKPIPNLAEQERRTVLVARLPKAPFWTLIGLNLLYALLGCVLAAVAYSSQPRIARDVQTRLSIPGLVAMLLLGRATESDHGGRVGNSVEGLFAENHGGSDGKVAIVDRGEEGWVLERVALSLAPSLQKPAGHPKEEHSDTADEEQEQDENDADAQETTPLASTHPQMATTRSDTDGDMPPPGPIRRLSSSV